MTQAYKKQKLEFLKMSPAFRQQILDLRGKWGIPRNGFSNFENRSTWEHRLLESSQSEKFNVEFDRLWSNLPQHYADGIYEYLVFDDLKYFTKESQKKVRFFWKSDERDRNKERLFIEVFSDTTIKDIQAIWPFILKVKKSAIGFKEGRQKSKTYLERDLMVLGLSEQKKSYKQIQKIIENQPACGRLDAFGISKNLNKTRKKIREL